MLDGTREEEWTCDECLPHLAVLVERRLAGAETGEALRMVEQHLAICPECVEELEAIREAIRGIEALRE